MNVTRRFPLREGAAMNRTLPWLCLLAALILLAGACGDSGDGGDTGSTGDTPADADSGAADGAGADEADVVSDAGGDLADAPPAGTDADAPGPADADAGGPDETGDADGDPQDADAATVDATADALPDADDEVQDTGSDIDDDVADVVDPDTSDAADATDAADLVEVIEPDCAVAGDCDTVAGICQAVACIDGECVLEDAPNGSSCDDGDACTESDGCQDGACAPGAAPDCSGLDATCLVGACDPATGECVAAPADDGALCNDDDACTALDSCQGGTCAGTPVVCSNLDDGCLVGACDDTTGDCVQVAAEADTPCDDEDPCTTLDVCTGGVCGGSAVVCEAGACETAVCSADSGECVVTAITDGSSCDDGSPCTGNDTCGLEGCAGAPVDCTDLDGPCVAGVCDAGTGECVPTAAPDGSECDDDDACSVGDECAAGVCASTPLDCSELDTPCAFGGCDVETGTCVQEVLDDTTPCDDDDLCTTSDECTGGICAGAATDCSDLDGNCLAGACDAGTGECVEAVAEDGTSCDSGEPCTVGATCSGGECGGDTIDCSGLDDACNLGVCDEDTLTCVEVPIDDGGVPIACDDEDACTTGDVCAAGACGGLAVDCSELDTECMIGACDGLTGECMATPRDDGVACDDLNECTVDDACAAGVCSGAGLDCSELDGPCVVGACSADTGDCEVQPLDDDEPCNDDQPCTDGDVCTDGACAGTPKACLAAGPCFVASCNEASGACEQEVADDNSICDDSDICTGGDTCTGGVCTGQPIDCEAETEVCFESFCDGSTGLCVTAPVQDGTDCVDSDPCYAEAVCVNGMCLGSNKDCSDFDGPCVVGACSPIGGGCYGAAIPDFLGCDDLNPCTSSDHCEEGECTGNEVNCSFAGDDCNAGVCDPATGGCTQEPAFDGEPCNDFNPCTESDFCAGGECTGDSVDCSGLDQGCNLGTCNPVTAGCELKPAPTGTPCDDTDPCTETDQCFGSVCQGTPLDCELPGGSCFTGSCSVAEGGCIETPREDGSNCDDGDTCSVGDQCLDAVCVGEVLDCTIYDGPCTTGLCDGITAACQLVLADIGDPCSDENPCTSGDICIEATCIGDYDDTIPGCGGAATCLTPTEITAVPFESAASTAGGSSDFEAAGCGLGSTGSGSGERLFRLFAPESGIYVARLVAPAAGTPFDSILYVFDDCPGAAEASCLGGDDVPGTTAGELVAVPLAAGESAWIVVDGAAADQAGDFVLTVELAPPAELVCDDELDLDYDGTTDCGDLDCLGVGDCLPALPIGSLAFVEVMAHPAAPLGPAGEWLEVRNTTDSELSLEGVSLAVTAWPSDADVPLAPTAAAALSTSSPVAAAARVVLAASGNPADNGGISASVSYVDLELSDTDNLTLQLVSPSWDTISAPPAELIIDTITIPAGTFAADTPGASASWQLHAELDSGTLTAADNDNVQNWCYTPAEVDYEYTPANYGTPAAVNTICVAPVTYATIQPILADKCTPCHEGPGPCSGEVCFATDYADTQLASNVCAELHVYECMLQRIQEGSMPFGEGCSVDPVIDEPFAACLDANQQALIQQWVEQGGNE